MLEGAYAFVGLTNKKLVGARDPLGIRPLVLGKLDGCPILASETCALDIIGAQYVRDVENGEVVVFDEDGAHSHKPFPPMPPRPCIFEYIYFARPDSIVGGRSVYDVRKTMRRGARARGAGRRRRRRPGAGFRRAGGDRLCAGIRHPLRARHHPQSLCRPHLHRADPAHPPARRAPQAQRQPRRGQRQAHRADRRFDRARHDLGEDRADDARCRRQRGAFPHRLAADHASRLLRHRHARAGQAARRHPRPRRHAAIHRRRFARLPVGRRHLPRHGRDGPRSGAAAIHRPLLHRRISDAADRPHRRRTPRRASSRCSPRRAERMPQPLADRIALVTGASRGIGYATALALARAGAHVVAVARTVGGLEELDDAVKRRRQLGDAGAARPARLSTASTGSPPRSTSATDGSTCWSAMPAWSAPPRRSATSSRKRGTR